MLETSIPEHADVAAPPSLGPRDGWAGARTSSSALHTALHLAPPGSRACPGPRCASLVQNSKLVKALQDSGLAAETGSDRVGVFGLENVRVYAPPPAPSVSRAAAVASLSLVPPSSEPRRWLQYGNTCYCNSVLQALYFCKPFREHVSGYRPAWLAEGEKVRGISSPSRCGSAADAAVTGRGSLSLSLFLSQSLDTSAAAATVAATTNATAIEVALAAAALAGE